MILGVGHDVVEIARIGRLLQSEQGERFLQRILTPSERAAAAGRRRIAEYMSGRYAAKEAVSKAMGCGIGAVLGFQDIEIVADAAGKPWAVLSTEGWKRLKKEDDCQIRLHVSITHERELASAFVIAEQMQN